jgi:hypothetical protein
MYIAEFPDSIIARHLRTKLVSVFILKQIKLIYETIKAD